MYKNEIHNQEQYIGYKKKSPYFEGWYFKHTDASCDYSISFIVGVSKSNDEHCFIQIIENINNQSYYLRFPIEYFSYSHEPFYIKINEHYFSLEKISLCIDNPKISVDLDYKNRTLIDKNKYMPNIMGPFAYLSFMECNHAVLSLRHQLNGIVEIENKEIDFNGGSGYIEKDYGVSFPKKYLWLQSNSSNENSIFLAIANIPLLRLRFIGLIGILEINHIQYRFASYYFARTKVIKKSEHCYYIRIKQWDKTLTLEIDISNPMELISPKNGKMKDTVKESLSSKCKVELKKKGKTVFNDTFLACGCEIFNY